jgi:hypothetical protein
LEEWLSLQHQNVLSSAAWPGTPPGMPRLKIWKTRCRALFRTCHSAQCLAILSPV